MNKYLLTGLILAAAVFLIYLLDEEPDEASLIKKIPLISGYVEKTDEDYLNLAIDGEDAAGCRRILNQSIRDYCYSQIALSTRNHSTCGRIQSLDKRYSCIYKVAIATRNMQLCDEIHYPYIKEQCMAYFK